MGPMQIDEYTKLFFEMEMAEELFSMQDPDGEGFWDVVRYEVFFSLYGRMNEPIEHRVLPVSLGGGHHPYRIDEFLFQIRAIATQWARLKLMSPSKFVAVICSRYRNSDGETIDYATEDAVQALSEIGSVQTIESGHNSCRSFNVNPLVGIEMRLHRPSATYERCFDNLALKIGEAEKKYFATTDPQILQVIRGVYRLYRAQRVVWGKVLTRSKPSLVLIMNGAQKGIILEARKRGIPVTECQHGVHSLMHPKYSYPPDLPPGNVAILPNSLLIFSRYWKEQCRMPGTEIIAVGTNCFSAGGSRSTRTGSVVFVSAEPFHELLSPVAIRMAKQMPGRSFVMKLHPSQLPNRATIEEEYEQTRNLVVIGMEKDMAELLAEASDLVVVQSTAAYEALDRGVPVHFLKAGSYISHKDLFSLPNVHLFSTIQELESLLFKPASQQEDGRRFFDPFDLELFLKHIRYLTGWRSDGAI
jgi:hypothetical protein